MRLNELKIIMKGKILINKLMKLGDSSAKEKYFGDATQYWFFADVLRLLKKQLKAYKDVEKQMKYMWQSLDDLELVK